MPNGWQTMSNRISGRSSTSSTRSAPSVLDADPSIRWQALRDLADVSEAEIAAERARVATEGWGAALLAGQSADGF
jgi:hypothetical protein